jgi:hypothetical protein
MATPALDLDPPVRHIIHIHPSAGGPFSDVSATWTNADTRGLRATLNTAHMLNLNS